MDAKWQTPILDELTGQLHADPDALALAVFGSVLDAEQMDAWSDLDLMLVVAEYAYSHFADDLAWLGGVGVIFGLERYRNPHNVVIRAAFTNGRSIDVILTTEAGLVQIEDWPRPVFRSRVRVMFSRSAIADRVFARPVDPPPLPSFSDEQFAVMVDAFWFRGKSAVKNVARGDLVIASHLAFEMAQDCLVLGMILRDRAEGTTIHKTGGEWNEIAMGFGAISTASAQDVLRLIEQSAVCFDELAGQWSAGYEPRAEHLIVMIERVHSGRTRSGLTK